jgi:hypothetical protein
MASARSPNMPRGNNPNIANPAPVITLGLVTAGANDFFSITYQQGLNVSDILFEIQESSDLENWTTIPAPILVEEKVDPDHSDERRSPDVFPIQ